jgi:hypothetical protein
MAIKRLRNLWGRWRPITVAATRCALCRAVIPLADFQCVVSKGQTYHAGCWERTIRQLEALKKSA